MSVHWPIIRSLLRWPLRTFIVDDNRSYRGIDLIVASLHVAAEIERRSSAPVVATMFPSSGAFPICALGAWMLGRAVVPLNFFLARDELQYVIDDCGTDIVLTAGPMLEHIGYEPRTPNLVRLDEMNFKSVPDLRMPRGAQPEDLAAMLYTSGTSGKPKGVRLTHGNVQANVEQCTEALEFARGQSLFGVLPQFHSFGFTCLTVVPLTLAMRAVYSARFVPQRIVRSFREHKPSFFVGIPSMYNALLQVKEAGPEDFASFRAMVSGGEPLPRDVANRFLDRFGINIWEGYGLTETSPVTHANRDNLVKPGTVGTPVPRVEQRIVDIETGLTLGTNLDGEVRLRGPNIFEGYHHLPEETAAAFDEQGWFRTGDIGRIDDEGFLAITGRLKEMIIVGGENVFPREIEEVLNGHPSVRASGVVGLNDPTRGEVPVAFIELEEGAVFDETALRSLCREKLAGYKVPRDIRVVETLPRNPTGKIMRRHLVPLLSSKPGAA